MGSRADETTTGFERPEDRSPLRVPAGDADLPDDVRSLASEILEQFEESGGDVGGERAAYAVGAVSIAADVCQRHVPIRDLAADIGPPGGSRTGGAVEDVERAERTIAAELGIDALPPAPQSHVETYSAELGLPDETAERAKGILRETYGDRDTAPTTAAAAAVYTASLFGGDRVSPTDVVGVADVSVTALKNAYRHQYDHVAGAREGSVGD